MPAKTTTPAAGLKDPIVTQGAFSVRTTGGEIKEDDLKQALVGKSFFLRGGYLDNTLDFDDSGHLLGHSAKGSYTLSQIQINKVKLSSHRLELDGDRYALHFLGAAPYEDPMAATDRVRITPKKKSVRLVFERERVEAPKRVKEKNKKKHRNQDQAMAKAAPAANPANADVDPEASPARDQAKPADQALPALKVADDHHGKNKKGTVAPSKVLASQGLLVALDNVFSRGIDDRMIDAMPDFWKLYYQAAAEKVDYKPTDPGVLRQSAVDQKARLISAIDPPSNEFAQANTIAGVALYHAVIGSDGKVEEVVVGRPIGFGLDESAEQTIRKATFQPAIKDGKPVPVALDLVVSFRIYSKRTSQPGLQTASDKPDEPILPGPYTAQANAQAALPDPQTPSQPTPNQQ